jgi:hypothetical protein
MDGYQYIYCLPPAGGRIRSQDYKMRRLRRRNHEWAEGCYEAYEVKNKGEKCL